MKSDEVGQLKYVSLFEKFVYRVLLKSDKVGLNFFSSIKRLACFSHCERKK